MSLIGRLRPAELPFRRRLKRSCVALIQRRNQHGDTELLFIQRAHRPGDPWSGDMAFPGGRVQPEDTSPRAAAIRETREETGLDLTRHGRFRKRLSDLLTRQHSRWRPMVVTPYLFDWLGPTGSSLNHEVDTLVWIPLAALTAAENQSRLHWRTPLGTLRLPCIRYQGHCIWGLSYSMLREYLRECAGPPERANG